MCVPLLDLSVVAAQLCVRWGQHPFTKQASSRRIGLVCGVLVSWGFSVVPAPWTEGSHLLLFFKKQRKHKSSGKDHLQEVKSYRSEKVYWGQQAAWNDSSEVWAHLSSSKLISLIWMKHQLWKFLSYEKQHYLSVLACWKGNRLVILWTSKQFPASIISFEILRFFFLIWSQLLQVCGICFLRFTP